MHISNNTFCIHSGPLKGVICCASKPKYCYTQTTTNGCVGGSVVIGGFRKVKNGYIQIDSRKFTHRHLESLEELYVQVYARDWLLTGFNLEGGIALIESNNPPHKKSFTRTFDSRLLGDV